MLLAPLTGFFQSFVPLANPMKFSTPIGALSGNNVQVILPAVVLIIAVGSVEVAGLGVPLGLAAAPVLAAGAALRSRLRHRSRHNYCHRYQNRKCLPHQCSLQLKKIVLRLQHGEIVRQPLPGFSYEQSGMRDQLGVILSVAAVQAERRIPRWVNLVHD